MLRLSADASNTDIDLQLVNGDAGAGAASDVPHSAELMRFAEAVAGRDPGRIAETRQDLFEAAGNDAVVDAAAVAGNFQRMVRIADATGIPVDDHMQALSGSIQDQLDLRRFPSAGNTPRPSALKRLVNVPRGLVMRHVVKLLGRR